MGEVGAALPEQQAESPCNGEVNGNCKADKMPMDASEDDSQVSSENGIVEYSQNNFSNNFKIAKAESLNSESMLRVVSVSSLATPQGDKGDSNSKPDAKQDSAENGVIVGTSQVSESMDVDDREDSKDNDEVEEEILRVQVRSNGSQQKEHEKISDEIEIIESDEEEQSNSSSMNSKMPAENSAVLMQTSELKIASVQENVEQMDVSVESNSRDAQNNVNNVKEDDSVLIQSDSEDGEYDTKDSDSQTSKHFSTEQENVSQTNHTVDDAQDEQEEDDCVVIEDDDKKEPEQPQTTTPIIRQRKSVVKPRDFTSYGDDDVEEIIDDASGQPPLKRMRTSIETSAITPNLANTSQVGQITIKDARTLMGPFAADPTNKHTYQQQLIQASGGKSGKEPTLVIIDTNTMPKMGTPGMNVPHGGPIISNVTNIQNVAKTNSPYQVMPVGGLPAQGVYPISVRPSLATINPAQQKVQAQMQPVGLSASPITNQNLLPALTDDMFVLEAPSFIVPYIYEKPPTDNLKEIIEKMSEEIKKMKKEEESKEDENSNSGEKSGDGETNEESKTDGTTNTEKKKKSRKNKNPDDSWDETDTSTDDEASDTESRTKVLIKNVKDDDLETIKAHVITPNPLNSSTTTDPEKKTDNYFESALGKFFIDIGINLVQEFVQTDLLRQQKRKRERVGKNSPEVQLAINSLKKNLETSRKKNEPFKFEIKRCEYCNFKAESALVMAHHYEAPHMRSYLYKCNFCAYEARPLHDMIYHMEAMHNIKGRFEKPLSYHQCPNCPFEDNGKSKLARHAPVCAKKFRPELNLIPPHDWEAPAKIPRIKPRHGLVGTATAYQAMAAQAAAQKAALASISAKSNVVNNNTMIRNRGRPQTVTRTTPAGGTVLRTTNTPAIRPQMPMVLPNNYQIAGGQLIQVAGSNVAILPNSNSSLTVQPAHTIKKGPGQQPSISITPLPRQPGGGATNMAASSPAAIPAATITPAAKAPVGAKPGQNPTGNKASFVICEICDGYIKDLEQLRHHMQWMHKVKIHPKMIYNRPPLNCQKCQFRFFTDQGLERHLLGSHGLVTSSMQEAANKGKDAGRCPVCGRMYQWKLLNHVSRDHHMTLKPAHLSYKCTVCTATFGMYKQFENHVYTAHSTVAKKAMDTKKPTNNAGMPTSSSNIQSNKSLSSFTSGDSLLKPLKINDEITIIPQPASRPRPSMNDYGNHIIDHSRKLKAKH